MDRLLPAAGLGGGARTTEAMDKICIKGGVPLEGVIPIGGAKNAALPLMAASLLTSETLTLKNVPVLADIATMANLLVQHGVSVVRGEEGEDSGSVVELCAGRLMWGQAS